jgi:hypothetical protein
VAGAATQDGSGRLTPHCQSPLNIPAVAMAAGKAICVAGLLCHHNRRANAHAAEEVNNVLIVHADATV